MLDLESITKYVGAGSAVLALLGGGYKTADEFGLFSRDILTWDPEHFSVSDGPSNGTFKVVVAREKHRDDCSVEGFALEVKDSGYIVHDAKPSIPKFSGPASDKVEMFAFTITIDRPYDVAKGKATLLAHIEYKCPEGIVYINYPSHQNLEFMIE